MANDKMALSKRIGQWDKGPIDTQQKENTLGEVRRAFNRDKEMQGLLRDGLLQLNLRGSANNANESNSTNDVDIHALFFTDKEITSLKDKCFGVLKKYFGDNVSRHRRAIRIKGNINRRSSDIIVSIYDNGKVIAYDDYEGKEIEFYPTDKQKNIAQKNIDTKNMYSKMVRIFKSIVFEMVENGERERKLKSFVIESLLINLKSSIFNKNKMSDSDEIRYKKRFCAILQSVEARLKDFEAAKQFVETDGESQLLKNTYDYNFVKEYWTSIRRYIKSNYNMGA